MGFTVSSLTDYVDQSSEELLTALQFENETAAYANVITGVKSSKALQILTNTVYLQDGDSDCTFNASGDTAFTQRNIVTKGVKIQDKFCLRALQAKWTQLLLKNGQKYTEADLPREIMRDIINIVNKNIEIHDWRGNTAAGSINRYDGLATIIKAATGTQTATAVSGPVTTSNVRTIMQNIIAKIPAAQLGDPNTKIFCGYDVAELYRQKIFIDNLYHVTASKDQKNMTAEGTVHEIVPVHGLDGLIANTGDNPFIFALDPSRNMYLGVDMEGEEEQADLWESKDDQDVKMSIRFRRGWQIAFPSEIVEYSNS